MNVTAYSVACRFLGVEEVAGPQSHPAILAMLQLDQRWPVDDATPWCSAFINYICWLLGVPRSRSLRARSWLSVGTRIPIARAIPGWDIVVFNRAGGPLDPAILDAPGHVGLFAKADESQVWLLSGNQGNAVTVQAYPRDQVLGVQRVWTEPSARFEDN